VPISFSLFEGYISVAESDVTVEDAVAQMPISDAAKVEFLRLQTIEEDQIPEIKGKAKWEYLYNISYRDFLSKHLSITEPEVFAVLQDLTSDDGVGIEATSAHSAIVYIGLPGCIRDRHLGHSIFNSHI